MTLSWAGKAAGGVLERFTEVTFDTAAGRLRGAQEFGARSPELMQMFAFALHAGMTASQAGDALFVFPGIPEALWYTVRPRPGGPQPGSA
jgi:pyruvate/2-oxoglutarate dehydrogenase complex dihydrolipoamide dehydrogenase (E3) component